MEALGKNVVRWVVGRQRTRLSSDIPRETQDVGDIIKASPQVLGSELGIGPNGVCCDGPCDELDGSVVDRVRSDL